MKKTLIIIMSSLACLSFASAAGAASSMNELQANNILTHEDTKTTQIPNALLEGAKEVTITDKEELEKFASEEGSSQIPVKIVYEYLPATENLEIKLPLPAPQLIEPKAAAAYTVTSKDFGFGQYDPIRDLYQEFYVPGPDTFEIEETTKRSSQYEGSFGASLSAIEASIGFQINKEHELKWKSTTPIAKGQNIRFQLFVTNHKVQYTVNTSTSCSFGYAYDPTGTLIKKIFY